MKLDYLSINRHLKYDFVFVSHLPSFYKINLFNEIAKYASVLAIFLGETSRERTADFVKGEKKFEYLFLNSGDFELRGRWVSSWRLCRILSKLEFKRISVGGWDLPESWAAMLCSPKQKNVITQESSIFESEVLGWKGHLKRLFSKRLGLALVSGEPHARLMRGIGFNGQIVVTGGVGLANRAERNAQRDRRFIGRFLYVGRLSPEKNLAFLLRVFAMPSMAGFHLTLVGDGPERDSLCTKAGSNVSFVGHVPNGDIQRIYASHDVFILPSLSEPWGLVIEEALYYGLPVLASSKVGSVEDLIESYCAGVAFDPLSERSLENAIQIVVRKYEQYANAARAIDFDERDAMQVQVYVDAVAREASQ
jgi:glycosyltransferase involved in cell wall biosynthesis